MGKYTPSYSTNNKLKEDFINEVLSTLYKIEKGKHDRMLDHDEVLICINGLKNDLESLQNTMGTGKETIDKIYEKAKSTIKAIKTNADKQVLNRLESAVDDTKYYISIWKSILNGDLPDFEEEQAQDSKLSYTRKMFSGRLQELDSLRTTLRENEKRLETEIIQIDKDTEDYNNAIAKEEDVRRIDEIYRKIQAQKVKKELLATRKANYISCYNLIDAIYTNAIEIVNASDLAKDEINLAKNLINMEKIKVVLTEPEKALSILASMQRDIENIFNRTKTIDKQMLNTDSIQNNIAPDALAYREEILKNKKK